MFWKFVFYLDLLVDYREGVNDNVFGIVFVFLKIFIIFEWFD